jgi:hypothetical protein
MGKADKVVPLVAAAAGLQSEASLHDKLQAAGEPKKCPYCGSEAIELHGMGFGGVDFDCRGCEGQFSYVADVSGEPVLCPRGSHTVRILDVEGPLQVNVGWISLVELYVYNLAGEVVTSGNMTIPACDTKQEAEFQRWLWLQLFENI